MKKLILCLAALCLALCACDAAPAPVESTPAPSATGTIEGGSWVELDGIVGYQDSLGNLLTGWQDIDGQRYRFSADGVMLTGWIQDNGLRYYLDENGKMCTGWQEFSGKRFYFREDGAMVSGWCQLEEGSYYFGVDGSMITGLMNVEGKGYYFGADGTMYSGWLELAGKTYYFAPDGVMAVGKAEIDGKTYYFNPHGVHVLLVNPWNSVPEDYAPELTELKQGGRIATACYEALMQMLADCEEAGFEPYIVSAYRTQKDQEYLFRRKINTLVEQGWSRENAEIEAAKNVAVPGTSEHQLGLAVDIIGSEYPYLDDNQADTASQQWLMEHCHEYGFILRYPKGTTDITGIVYEPWHYRYVGQEIAQEIANLGITLEEYLGAA